MLRAEQFRDWSVGLQQVNDCMKEQGGGRGEGERKKRAGEESGSALASGLP